MKCFGILIVLSVGVTELIGNVHKGIIGELMKSNRVNDFKISEYITSCGYPFELHENLRTPDGYLLDVQRIPHGRNNNNTKGPAVLLMHGLLGSAENWILLGCEKALAFLLADQGFDVWLGNARGTTHSRKHLTLDPDNDNTFWHFSWHEIGIYDLPTKINYIRNETNQDEIFYIGHSQGTTSYFVMMSEKPEYNSYIKAMIALAPAVYVSLTHSEPEHHGENFITKFIKDTFLKVINETGTEELRPSKEYKFCVDLGSLSRLCPTLMATIHFNAESLEKDVLKRAEETFPAGASVRQFIHYSQELASDTFSHYDYGEKENLRKYGSTEPPSYNLTLVSTPVAIYYAKNDKLTSSENVEKFAKELTHLNLLYLVPSDNFTHFDFVVSDEAANLVYPMILSEIKKFL